VRSVRRGAAGANPRRRRRPARPHAALDGLARGWSRTAEGSTVGGMRKTPVVLGVLAMGFGGIQVLMTGIGLATAPFSKEMIGGMGKALSGLPKQEGQPDVGDMFDKLAKLTDELKLYTYLTGFAMLAFAITLIILGWMLYKRRMQSRPLSVAWGAAALAYL